jgi:hypothetical protein
MVGGQLSQREEHEQRGGGRKEVDAEYSMQFTVV